MLSDNELRRLARYIVMEQASNEQWLTAFAKAQAKINKPVKRLVSLREASKMLGVSRSWMYQNKHNFSFVKKDGRNSPIRFNAATLLQEYESYQAKK